MLDDITQLYQEMILEHSKSPRNEGVLSHANHKAHGHNPLCGDEIELYVQVENGTIQDISFVGDGCAISRASSSLMTESLKGKSVKEAQHLFEAFHALLTTDNAVDEKALHKLMSLKGVKQFPVRVKCATLAWHTFEAALHSPNSIATTE